MSQHSIDIVTQTLTAIERRDATQLRALYHPQVEFYWPPGLSYGGAFVGPQVADMNRRFLETWDPLQPTEAERRIDFTIVAASGSGDVVVRYLQKGVSSRGQRFETLTLAEYQVRDGRFARAQMYYFDLPGLISFLEATQQAQRPPPMSGGVP